MYVLRMWLYWLRHPRRAAAWDRAYRSGDLAQMEAVVLEDMRRGGLPR